MKKKRDNKTFIVLRLDPEIKSRILSAKRVMAALTFEDLSLNKFALKAILEKVERIEGKGGDGT